MSFTLDTLTFLASEKGQQALSQLTEFAPDFLNNDKNTLSILTNLRKSFSADQASALLSMSRLRYKAKSKFGDLAQILFFEETALEQASDPLIRSYRQAWAKDAHLIDAGCSIGSDSLSFAQQAHSVLGLDIDELRLWIARYNASKTGLNPIFKAYDITLPLPDTYDHIFFDPARRDEKGKRIFNVDHYQPPLSIVQQWKAYNVLIKLAPGILDEQLSAYGGKLEFISVNGDLKEALLYLNEALAKQATLLQEDAVFHFQRQFEPELQIADPRGWLLEPDPALLRAGLVRDFANQYGATMLDETIAYLTRDTYLDSPWVRCWQIEDWMPYNLKKLRAYLQSRGIGQVTIKKRGVPFTPDQLQKDLKLKKGDRSCTLILTRYQNHPIVMLCTDITNMFEMPPAT